MKKLIITILVILVALVAFLIFKSSKVVVKNTDNHEPIPETTTGASGQFAKLASNAVYVQDQLPGDTVIIAAASLEEGGFIVIKKDEGGNPGAIIGVSEFLVPQGYDKFDIGTTESLADGLRYYAVLYKDDGNGIFDPKNDTLVYSKISNGKEVVMSRFMVDKKAVDPRTTQINF